jgi:uncharacterized membrane protein YdbT with pleckstrin-like domain
MDSEINNILESKERVVWQGVVSRKVLSFSFFSSLVILGIIASILFSISTINYTSNGQPGQISGSIVGMGILLVGLSLSTLSYFSDKVKNFAITRKRVIIKSGLIGTDFKSIYYDQMKNIIVDVGLLGKIFSVGTVKIDTGKTETYTTGGSRRGKYNSSRVRTRTVYDNLKYIERPYEVYKRLQSSLSGRKERLYSGRADRESNS